MYKISLDGRKDVPPACTNSIRADHSHTIHIPCPSDRPWFLLLLLEKADLAVLSCECQAPGVTHLRSQGVTVHLHRHPSTSLELCFSTPQKGSQKPCAARKHSLLRIKPKHLQLWCISYIKFPQLSSLATLLFVAAQSEMSDHDCEMFITSQMCGSSSATGTCSRSFVFALLLLPPKLTNLL